MQLALAERHRQMCESYTTKAKDTGTKNVSFRDKVRAKTGLDIYAAGDAALSFAGAVGSVVAAGVGILAVPETGGAGLILTAFGASSAVFAASDFVEYIHDINVGKDGEYRHGTENRSYNPMYDGLFNGNVTAYNNVRTFTDLGTMIFGIGTSVTASKPPAQKIKDVAGKNKTYSPLDNYSWGNNDTLNDHYARHGKDVGATSAQDYAKKANDFYNNRSNYQVKVDTDGVIRVYDSQTNVFGSYNVDGTTKTLFSPKSGQKYFDSQPGNIVN